MSCIFLRVNSLGSLVLHDNKLISIIMYIDNFFFFHIFSPTRIFINS
ncbi:hypothetical protein BBU64B_F0008 (plasmid) [Borreliella burgdorferi 64b]|nr:hypothetical protein BBU64B_F0008 [Borreliella burgdorferi 64b]